MTATTDPKPTTCSIPFRPNEAFDIPCSRWLPPGTREVGAPNDPLPPQWLLERDIPWDEVRAALGRAQPPTIEARTIRLARILAEGKVGDERPEMTRPVAT